MTSKEIIAVRTQLELTQAQLAEELGVNTSTVARWEQGNQDPPAYLRLALEKLKENK